MRENLQLGILGKPGKHDLAAIVDEIAETFPRLKERLDQEGSSPSGGDRTAKVHSGSAQALLADREIQERYCAV